MLGGSLLHPFQIVKAAVFVCLLIALPLGGNAQAAAEDSKPAAAGSDGWDDTYCRWDKSWTFDFARSRLLGSLNPASPMIFAWGRSMGTDQFVTLSSAQWDDLRSCLNEERMSTGTLFLLEDIVRKRYGAWGSAYRVLSEFHAVTPGNMRLDSPWGTPSDELRALQVLKADGHLVDEDLAYEVASAVVLESIQTLPRDFGEYDERTYLLCGSPLFRDSQKQDVFSAGLLTYVRYGDWLPRPFELPTATVSSDAIARRRVLYWIIHCPEPEQEESLFLAIERIPDALHQRWAIHGGLEKSPSHDFSLPVQDFITAAVQISKRAGRKPIDWGTQLNNDLKDLEDEVRENKRKFPRPSTAQGDDARDRILEQLAEIRAYLEPHL